ncbi:MAG: hypothetical protein GXO74_00880 [Calditrichaeota bacterium]|nr:hypothetical protein [Calditrichota bacterium]
MSGELIELIRSRRSIRKYQDKPVEREKIISCLEAARLAPSAENVQPWRFIVIDEPKILKNFTDYVFSGIYAPTKFAKKAPVIVVVLARLDLIANRIGKQIQGIHYYFIDIGIAGEHFVLRAHELGLGTCWIGWFNPRRARKFFKIPKKYKIVSLMSVGYPAQEKGPVTKRRDLNEIVFFNGLQNNGAE